METPSQVKEACLQIAEYFDGVRGIFAYQAFEYINKTFFANQLPYPLIRWELTPHGSCLGYAKMNKPSICLHPSTLGGTESETPWGISSKYLGWCFAYDVLLHECIHVYLKFVIGYTGQTGQTSHNNPCWISEINRLAKMLGFSNIQAGSSKIRRVSILGTKTITGKQETKVVRMNDGNLPQMVISTFPYGLREYKEDMSFYEKKQLPFTFRPRGTINYEDREK